MPFIGPGVHLGPACSPRYRCFVANFGSEAPRQLLDAITAGEESLEEAKAALSPQQQSAHERRRLEVDADRDQSGRWAIPPPVLDEAAFLARLKGDETSTS